MLKECIVFLASFFLSVSAYDTHHFKSSHYVIKNKKLKRSGRMVVLSDLHGNEYGRDSEKLIKAVAKAKPDLILIPGDLITGIGSFEIPPMAKLVAGVSKIAPVYMSMGNHESKVKWMPKKFDYTYGQLKQQLTEAGAILLDNASAYLPEWNMEIKGLTLGWSYFWRDMQIMPTEKELERACGEIHEERFTLMAAHNPEYFDSYANYGPDLTISGHLHGGIMQLPRMGGVISPKYVLFPPYAQGKYEKNGKKMIVSRGLGSHTIPLRFFNPGDMVVIDFKTK